MRTAPWQSQPANLCNGWCVTSIWSGKLIHIHRHVIWSSRLKTVHLGRLRVGWLGFQPASLAYFRNLQ